MLHSGYNNVVTSTNPALRYKFGGKEYNEELGLNWYDISARNYDPAIGRWMNIDPLADLYPSVSPYNYAFNNPVNFLDADGRAPDPVLSAVIMEAIQNSILKALRSKIIGLYQDAYGMENFSNFPTLASVPNNKKYKYKDSFFSFMPKGTIQYSDCKIRT